MTIKLASKSQVQAPPPFKPRDNRFKKEDIEWLFSQNKDWNDFYEKNKKRFDKLDIYEWCVFPLMEEKDGPFYRCKLHPSVEVKAGETKTYTFPYRNIHFSEFISHCIFYRPEEHKAFIMDKLFDK